MTFCTLLAAIGLTLCQPPQHDQTLEAIAALTADVREMKAADESDRAERRRAEELARARKAWFYGGVGDNPRIEEPVVGRD